MQKSESPELWDMRVSPNVPGFILPLQGLKNTAAKGLIIENAIET